MFPEAFWMDKLELTVYRLMSLLTNYSPAPVVEANEKVHLRLVDQFGT